MREDASGGVNDDLPMVSQLAFKEGPVPSFLVPPRLVFPYPQVFVLTASTPYTKRGGGGGRKQHSIPNPPQCNHRNGRAATFGIRKTRSVHIRLPKRIAVTSYTGKFEEYSASNVE